jgi:pimeloyl-ACP methyl ester carboxylesterase
MADRQHHLTFALDELMVPDDVELHGPHGLDDGCTRDQLPRLATTAGVQMTGRLVPIALAIGLCSITAPCIAQASRLLERREVRVDGHPMTVWGKRPATEARGAILLVHGRTWSSRPNFDLRVPDSRSNASLMDALVARGYAVYALDQRGYGGTPRDSSGWLTPDRAERDVSAVLDWVRARQETGNGSRPRGAHVAPAVLLGYSRGSQVAMLVAQRNPEKIAGLVLYGYPDPAGRAGVQDPAVPPRRHTTAAAAGEDFISPAVTPPGVKEAYVRTATLTDSIRTDWKLESQFAEIDPALVHTPTLLIDGERDPYASAANHPAVFARLGTGDKWWVMLPGADHAAHLELQDAFVNALVAFMERRSP